MSFSGTKGYLTKPKPGVRINPLHPLSRGLVGYWLFNERVGSQVYDISRYGNHGMLKNMSPNAPNSGWGGSKFGGSLKFDGVNDYVALTKLKLSDGDSFTIVANVNFAVIDTNTIIISEGTNTNIATDGFHLFKSAGNHIFFTVGNGTAGVYASYDLDNLSTFGSNKDYQIVAVYDNSTGLAKVYFNSILLATSLELTGGYSTYSANLPLVGRLSYTSAWFFNGSIDSVRIYNHALSAEDIMTLYLDPFCNLLQVPIRRYFVAAPPVGAIMNQFQRANIGADLYNGAIIA